MGVVLASGSPRRRELLKMIGIEDFKVIPAGVSEELPAGLSPEETVRAIAVKKAEEVAEECDDGDMIIAADTLVYLDGRPFGKPEDMDDAAAMLRALSGRGHKVYSGLAVFKGGRQMTGVEVTDVFFRRISDAEISSYVKTGEPADKAGAYGAQGRAAVFIERIEGDFYNVMGLPLCRLSMMLNNFR